MDTILELEETYLRCRVLGGPNKRHIPAAQETGVVKQDVGNENYGCSLRKKHEK